MLLLYHIPYRDYWESIASYPPMTNILGSDSTDSLNTSQELFCLLHKLVLGLIFVFCLGKWDSWQSMAVLTQQGYPQETRGGNLHFRHMDQCEPRMDWHMGLAGYQRTRYPCHIYSDCHGFVTGWRLYLCKSSYRKNTHTHTHTDTVTVTQMHCVSVTRTAW